MSSVGLETPASRTLAAVLRRVTRPERGVELLLATGGAALPAGEQVIYVNVVLEGVTLKVPRLSGAALPDVGGPAYLLASPSFLVYLGTVKA